jgi:hypothetical protein
MTTHEIIIALAAFIAGVSASGETAKWLYFHRTIARIMAAKWWRGQRPDWHRLTPGNARLREEVRQLTAANDYLQRKISALESGKPTPPVPPEIVP